MVALPRAQRIAKPSHVPKLSHGGLQELSQVPTHVLVKRVSLLLCLQPHGHAENDCFSTRDCQARGGWHNRYQQCCRILVYIITVSKGLPVTQSATKDCTRKHCDAWRNRLEDRMWRPCGSKYQCEALAKVHLRPYVQLSWPFAPSI